MLKYKGYTGRAEFDDESGIFHGEVLDCIFRPNRPSNSV
jgi:predicted HicB family RNase H-like nuclease